MELYLNISEGFMFLFLAVVVVISAPDRLDYIAALFQLYRPK